jgi:hypothetical protein
VRDTSNRDEDFESNSKPHADLNHVHVHTFFFFAFLGPHNTTSISRSTIAIVVCTQLRTRTPPTNTYQPIDRITYRELVETGGTQTTTHMVSDDACGKRHVRKRIKEVNRVLREAPDGQFEERSVLHRNKNLREREKKKQFFLEPQRVANVRSLYGHLSGNLNQITHHPRGEITSPKRREEHR